MIVSCAPCVQRTGENRLDDRENTVFCAQILCGADDGLDGPALPRLSPPLEPARAAIHGDGDGPGHSPRRPPALAGL